jgi:hypothetical protein
MREEESIIAFKTIFPLYRHLLQIVAHCEDIIKGLVREALP